MSSAAFHSVHLPKLTLPQGISRTFPSLENRSFRLLLSGLLVSGTGGWIQRIAQDWLVLTMTDSPTAVGVVTAFQFVPTLLLGLHGGLLADRFPKRTILLATQVSMALTAAALAALTLSGAVQVWHVFGLAFVLGVVAAVDNPTRQSFVSEVVTGPQLPNAISLVSCTFQIGAMTGPVIGGVLMSTMGAGYAFAVNAATFVGPIVALSLMRDTGHRPGAATAAGAATAPATGVDTAQTVQVSASQVAASDVPASPRVRDGLAYALHTPNVLWPVVMVGAFGFFTISLPVTLAAFAKNEFHTGASGLGLLNAMVAVGALGGALATARRTRPLRLRTVGYAAWALAVALLLAAGARYQLLFTLVLVLVGAANLGFLTKAQSLVQLAAVDHLRGRVVGIYMLVFIGSGAIGGPVVGWLAEAHGARIALLASGAVPAVVTAVVTHRLARRADLRLGLTAVSVRLPRPSVVPRNH
ncbi:MFS transporter [Pedococcus sp. 2YAF34]|uniref:MFS transporter n=1 Tax=Pedococcus sp. 2YAF34 TaxID=3233032 RepID=UPI003F98E0A2